MDAEEKVAEASAWTEPASMGPSPSTDAAVPDQPAPRAEIATLVAAPASAELGDLDPTTGEPVRPISVAVGATLSWLSVAASAASLLWTYWVAVDHFAQASWLTAQFPTEPGALLRVGLMAGLTVAVLLAMIANTIVGFYAWTGYRWTRIAGLIGAGLSVLLLLGGRLGWAAIPLAVAGAGLLWLPSARRYFDAWWRLRHPSVAYAPPTQNVQYGPLARYR
ncbi:hypothetical protein ATK74_0145 [Propionicimonas paludicola]|uniref:Uncharacterized protein n=1 Tax=Propionicimonas paludicola TaxID=185243 RepID=A0A2A9CNG2_9ACTN|nr:hypothetical protein [Propionicimonas paludicola]PFG15625.1 hypothetical protein ATK74_0145 [Propionicimonas paludicola]